MNENYAGSAKRPSKDQHQKLRIAVIYHMLPHYREAVFRYLDKSNTCEFFFFSSNSDYRGIKHLNTSVLNNFSSAPFRWYGPVLWQSSAVRLSLMYPAFDAIVFLSDTHFASTWVGAALARLRRIPVVFWGHGWLKHEEWPKSSIRRAFYLLANHLLVYGERAAQLGIAANYPSERITVVYNSLDFDAAKVIFEDIESGRLATVNPKELFNTDGSLLICTARLTRQCNFDLLIEAAQILRSKGIIINIILVGDGPERARLERMALALDVSVNFFGACYNEETIAQLIYHSDLTVSPGKIGLTAVHSMMYGTPAITHSDMNEQMPEAETIIVGHTGAFFESGNPTSLAQKIQDWIRSGRDRATVRSECLRVISSKWNPKTQSELIEKALVETIEKG